MNEDQCLPPAIVRCRCHVCDQAIEFPMEMAGQTIECPTCKMETYLFVPPDQKEKMVQSHPGLADTRNRYYILAGFAVFAVILGVAINRHFAEQIKESNNFNAEFSDNHPFENAAIAMTNELA